METSEESTYNYLAKRCIDAGVNITQLCEEANVPRSTIARWKKLEPYTIQLFRALDSKLNEHLEKKKKETVK